jgi:hypothetical protein
VRQRTNLACPLAMKVSALKAPKKEPAIAPCRAPRHTL